MNKNGQVLVLFVILIPVFIACLALVIDVGYGLHHSYKLNNINRMIIKYGLGHINDNDVRSTMIDLLYKNDEGIDSYELSIEEDKINLKIIKTIDSVFGTVINIKYYTVVSEYRGYIRDSKFVIEKG